MGSPSSLINTNFTCPQRIRCVCLSNESVSRKSQRNIYILYIVPSDAHGRRLHVVTFRCVAVCVEICGRTFALEPLLHLLLRTCSLISVLSFLNTNKHQTNIIRKSCTMRSERWTAGWGAASSTSVTITCPMHSCSSTSTPRYGAMVPAISRTAGKQFLQHGVRQKR